MPRRKVRRRLPGVLGPALAPFARHRKVLLTGAALFAAAGVGTAGLTWVSSSGASAGKPIMEAAPTAPTSPGMCTLLVGNRAHSMDVDRARTLTMIAAVGTQVGAVDAQIARAFDVSLHDVKKYLPNVTDALRLLAADDATPATANSIAEVRALASPTAMSCAFDPIEVPAERKGVDGLTPRADIVRKSLVDAFGKLPTTAAAKGTVADGTVLDVSLAPLTETKRATGWVLANWLVARGSTYRLDRVSFDNHTWENAQGWKNVQATASAATTAPPGGALATAAANAAGASSAAHHVDGVRIVVEKGD